ncbi:MAG: hypothetical protein KME64_20590 [Scytonematopsis contorta HA4267-MV1]|jgi:mRNA-degrading endonuclease RelE of RelBE toxin-antitoxin system|nr:hypothetical protein [Scytonematopsis contorta HA4267-MV1]
MYEIEFTPEAVTDLRYFRKFEQNIIIDAMQTQLPYEPDIETKNRFRREPADIADWELRIGVFRVFYNVDKQYRNFTKKFYKPAIKVFISNLGLLPISAI